MFGKVLHLLDEDVNVVIAIKSYIDGQIRNTL